MTTEAGTQQCRVLIRAKLQIESLLHELEGLDNSEHLLTQLRAIYSELQDRHDLVTVQRRSGGGASALPPQFGWLESWWHNEVS